MSKYLTETTLTLVLLVLIFCFLNPLDWWMPTMVHMILLGLLVVVFTVYVMFVWKEYVVDEREQLHRALAARFAYSVGGAIILIGIVIQTFSHSLDPWLPLSLGGMVLAKIAGRLWAEKHH